MENKINIFKGQIENAIKAYSLKKEIPEKLRCYLDFRPKATGITLVSFFDFAPMRGLEMNSKNVKEILTQLKKQQDFLLSPNKDEQEKIEKIGKFGFLAKSNKKEEYLEEDIQAFLIREILSSSDKDIPQRIAKICGFSGLKYLTSEFEWSDKGKIDRIDILCCDKLNYNRVVILELKKIRTTKLSQARYFKTLKDNESSLKELISALTSKEFDKKDSIELKMIYLMPGHPRLEEEFWRGVVSRADINGIIFYKMGFSFDRSVV